MKHDLNVLLQGNPYPGRGIVLGRSADGKCAAIAYFIMGRSENSRNRIFEATEDGIRTKAYDESKMTDPSLIIYHPVRNMGPVATIVTNGDQTETIRKHMEEGLGYHQALLKRAFEPDAPHYTPRISGVVKPDGGYSLSILKSMDGDPGCCCRFFYEYRTPIAGTGHFIHTYQGDGSPLPSFEGEPRLVSVTAPDARIWAEELWANLNEENKVSLFAEFIDLAEGKRDTVILNKHN